MSDPPARSSYQATIYWYSLLFLGFLVTANLFVYQQQKESLYGEMNRSAHTMFDMLYQLGREGLLSENYALVEWFFNRWGERYGEITALSLTSETGFHLVNYHQPDSRSDLIIERSIDAGPGERYTLHLAISSAAIKTQLNRLLLQLLVASTIATLLLALFAWLLFRWKALRPLEQEIERRHLAERQIYQQTRFLQTIIDSVDEHIMVIGPDYEVRLMNRAAKSGMDPRIVADPEHPKCYEVSHHRTTPCGGSDHPCPYDEVMRTRAYCSVIHNHSLPDGSPHFIELHASPMWCNLDGFNGIIEVGVNVTEHLEARNELIAEQQNLLHQAHHDPLTSLPNRRMFIDRLEQAVASAKRRRSSLALLFVDLDHFKEINDSLGHRAGDEVLRHISKQLQRNVRRNDAITRMGGDEFTIILEDIAHPDQAATIAGKLVTELQRPFTIDRRLAKVTSSIGIAIFPDNGEEAQTLLDRADEAMYHAKEMGRNKYCFYRHPAESTD